MVINNEPVSKVCEEVGISRTLFYRWLQRYKKEGQVAPKHRGRIKPQRVPEDQVLQILELVISHPQWSSQKISNGLETGSKGKPLVGNHGVQNVLQRLDLNTIVYREAFAEKVKRLSLSLKDALRVAKGEVRLEERTAKPVLLAKELNPQQRLDMIERVVKFNEPVVKVCKDYQISRPTLYKWLKRYQGAVEEERAEVLVDRKPVVERYYQQTPEKYEEAVLSVVAQYPEFGVERVVQALPQIAGEPIVGHHGVQNILRRHDLNTYEQRLAYARTQITPVTKFISVFEGLGTRFVILPVEARAKIIKFVGISLLTAFLTIVVFGFMGYMATVAAGVPMNARIGLGFASMALMVGSIFFAYSMKYYLTLALVLSFSRQTEEGGGLAIGLNGPSTLRQAQGSGLNGNGKGWLQRIFGLNGSLRGPTSLKSSTEVGPHQVPAGGLQPNLDHIQLNRYPFVSIHLPFYNEKKVAERILAACTSIDYPSTRGSTGSPLRSGQVLPNFEIIVCDDSTDETTTIVQRFADQWNGRQKTESRRQKAEDRGPTIKILHRETREGFKGGALKEALKHMDPRTEFVIVFDADFIPYPDTIEQFLKYFKATGGWEEKESYQAGKISSMPYETFQKVEISTSTSSVLDHQLSAIRQKANIACVAGYQWHVLNKSENWITRGVRTEYAGSYVIERPGQEILSALKIIHGSVYMIRADVLKHFGWGTSITEDFELTLRIYEKGFKVVYTPYVQAPSECVSTIKRLIRQRMRWSEGHSFNVRKMFVRLMLGSFRRSDLKGGPTSPGKDKTWVSSPLTLMEKLELLYISPYYLQAAFFLLGTFSWLISETIFKARLPFWTSLWGWSLVLTNFFALPLVNAVGLFLEESEEKDYIGLLSFVALSYLLVPFQAYASVKGFLEKQEGPWFRTPKTGLITDIFTRGRFYRWIAGILPGRIAPVAQISLQRSDLFKVFDRGRTSMESLNPYLALATANNQFNNFRIVRKKFPWLAKGSLAILLALTTTLMYFSRNVQLVYACDWGSPLQLTTLNGEAGTSFPAWGNFLSNSNSYGSGGQKKTLRRNNANGGTNNYFWLSNLWPNGAGNARIPPGQYYIQFAKSGNGGTMGGNNRINFQVQLFLTNNNGTGRAQLTQWIYMIRTNNADNVVQQYYIGNIVGNNITSAARNRLAVRIQQNNQSNDRNTSLWINILMNNSAAPIRLITPGTITVPEIPKLVIMTILLVIIPVMPMLVSGRLRRPGQNIFEEFVLAWKDLIRQLTGIGEEGLDELPV